MNVFSANGAADKARRRVTEPPTEGFSKGNQRLGTVRMVNSEGEQFQS